MKKSKTDIIFETGQQQAVASWFNYLNQLRLDQLVRDLNEIEANYDLRGAIKIINQTMSQISKEIIERNRGAQKGMHGFIAECAEVGVNNAWLKYEKKVPIYEWINDNSPADIKKGVTLIQQKFYNAGNNLSLDAVRKHLQAYPDFLDKGGKYQIPKDQFEKIKYLLDMPADVANKMKTSDGSFSLKQWRKVHEFFEKGDVKLSDFEEAKLDYKSVQKNVIHKTLNNEKQEIKDNYKSLKDKAYDNSKPTVEEGLKAAEISAAIEGGVTLTVSIIKKLKSGKQLTDFTGEDWKEILQETGISTVKGAIRGASIYTLTNYTATPAAVANSIVTASFGIANQANLFRQGKISKEEFLLNSQMVCIDTSVSALSSFIGQAIIPVPVIGAVIGNTVGTLMYQIAKDNLSKYEQNLMKKYLKDLETLDKELDAKYQAFVQEIKKELVAYYKLLDSAFSPNYKDAFDGSIALAMHVGVPSEKILKDTSEIDRYFLT